MPRARTKRKAQTRQVTKLKRLLEMTNIGTNRMKSSSRVIDQVPEMNLFSQSTADWGGPPGHHRWGSSGASLVPDFVKANHPYCDPSQSTWELKERATWLLKRWKTGKSVLKWWCFGEAKLCVLLFCFPQCPWLLDMESPRPGESWRHLSLCGYTWDSQGEGWKLKWSNF